MGWPNLPDLYSPDTWGWKYVGGLLNNTLEVVGDSVPWAVAIFNRKLLAQKVAVNVAQKLLPEPIHIGSLPPVVRFLLRPLAESDLVPGVATGPGAYVLLESEAIEAAKAWLAGQAERLVRGAIGDGSDGGPVVYALPVWFTDP